MAPRHHTLSHKVLYLPEENISRINYLRGIEEKKNYKLVIGYTDLGAFLTPLSVTSIQKNIKYLQKIIGDKIFDPCSIRKGMTSENLPHINIEMKSFLDIDADDLNFEVISL